MKRTIFIIILLGMVAVYLGSCKIDHGLGPIDESTGISGAITFLGEWPEPGAMLLLSDVWLFGPIAHTEQIPKDSLSMMSVYGIYSEYPQRFSYMNYDSLYNLLTEQGVDLTAENCTVKINYEIGPLQPALFKWIFFIAIPSSHFPALDSLQFYIMSTYYEYGDSAEPGQILVEDGRMIKEINLTVDFDVFRELLDDSNRCYSNELDFDKNREVRNDLFK